MYFLFFILIFVFTGASAQGVDDEAYEASEQAYRQYVGSESTGEADPYSVVSFSVSGSEYSRYLSLDTSIAVSRFNYLIAGHSTSQDWEEEGDGFDSKTNSFFIGLARDFSEALSGSLYFDYWGQQDNLVTRGLAGRLIYLVGDWKFSVDGGYRIIRYRAVGSMENSPSPYIGGGLGFYGVEPLGFFIDHTKYFFEDDISAMENAFFSSRIPLSVIILSSGFVTERTSVGISYYARKFAVDVEGFQSATVIDPIRIRGLNLRFNREISASWNVSVEGGRSVRDDGEADATTYGGAAVSYFW